MEILVDSFWRTETHYSRNPCSRGLISTKLATVKMHGHMEIIVSQEKDKAITAAFSAGVRQPLTFTMMTDQEQRGMGIRQPNPNGGNGPRQPTPTPKPIQTPPTKK